MKKHILFSLLSVSLMGLKAQVVLNLQLPPTGLTVKSQLWNLSIVNTANQSIQVQVELSMINTLNNQTVMTATTRSIFIPKGLKQLRAADVSPVVYNVMGGGFNVDPGPDGFLPVGNFQLCYTVIRQDLEVSDRVAEECETVVIEPISPPQLVSPSDSESVELSRPLFNWLPPSPYQLFTNLTYDFNLVEVQSIQNGAEAMQQNIPLETQSDLRTVNLQYPVSLPELDTGRLYAWQITALSGGAEVAKSEVWTFRVKKNLPDSAKMPPVSYFRMKRESDAGYAVCHGILYYEYENVWNDTLAAIRVSDIGAPGSKGISLDSSWVNLHLGQNLCKLDFTTGSILRNKHMYLLELINSRQEHWYVKFEYRQSN